MSENLLENLKDQGYIILICGECGSYQFSPDDQFGDKNYTVNPYRYKTENKKMIFYFICMSCGEMTSFFPSNDEYNKIENDDLRGFYKNTLILQEKILNGDYEKMIEEKAKKEIEKLEKRIKAQLMFGDIFD